MGQILQRAAQAQAQQQEQQLFSQIGAAMMGNTLALGGNPPAQAPQQRAPFDKSRVKCFECGEFGHFGRECKQRIAREERAVEEKCERVLAARGFIKQEPAPPSTSTAASAGRTGSSFRH